MRTTGTGRAWYRRWDGWEPVLRRRGRASAEFATGLRRELVRWGHALHVPADLIQDIGLAAYEAMANAVLHAYPRGTIGVLELHARLSRHVLTVTVVDRGRWRGEAAASGGGRGLPLIRELPHHTEISTGEFGTAVSMSWRGLAILPSERDGEAAPS